MTGFFTENFILIYFLYGLSFFSMGLAVLLELGHTSESEFSKSLRPLAAFGLIHGLHEWFEMYLLIHKHLNLAPFGAWIFPIRMLLLTSSFLMLLIFGSLLIRGETSHRLITLSSLIPTLIWGGGLVWLYWMELPAGEREIVADVYTRYSLAVPGAVLTGWGLLIQRKRFIQAKMGSFGVDVTLAAIAFLLYGVIGQVFASPSSLFPSTFLNSAAFLKWFGFPIQVFRASMATMAAIFIIRSLRSFEVEQARRIDLLRLSQLQERERSENLRAELLHRIVNAQESERQRIARELHDQTGQTLTALGMGLRGLSANIQANPDRAIMQAGRLEEAASSGILELQHIVSGLRPPQLDDLGLVAALRWYAGEVSANSGITIQVSGPLHGLTLSPELRVILFRIAQEALTNVIRHSGATKAKIQVSRISGELQMTIEDNGVGFAFDQEKVLKQDQAKECLGLVGMIERASLVGGNCKITSRLGQGTIITIKLPLTVEEGNYGNG